MDMKKARRCAELIARKRAVENELRSIKDEINELEPSLIQELIEDQVDRLPIKVGDDRVTLYIHRQLWVRPKDGDKDAVIQTLKRCGLSDFVSEGYNTNSLSAYVRERIGNGQPLQPTLAEVVRVDESVSIRGRRSPASSDSQTAKAMRNLRG